MAMNTTQMLARLILEVFRMAMDEWNEIEENDYCDAGEWMNENGLIPEGWTFVGSGGYRAAFLGPDGLVYKVDHDLDGNAMEAAAWAMLMRDYPECLNDKIRPALTEVIEFDGEIVIVQEFVASSDRTQDPYDEYPTPEDWEAAKWTHEFWDIDNSYNGIFNGSEWVIVDFQM